MLRIIMAGPLPPAIGGMATVIDDVAHSSLAEKVDLVLFDTSKRTPQNRAWWQALYTRFLIWHAWWRVLKSKEPAIAHIHTCSGLTYFLDGMLAVLARLHRVPVILHIHGARFDNFLAGLSTPRIWLARRIANLASYTVVLSEEWRQTLEQYLPGARLAVIENGVAESPRIAVEKVEGEIIVLFLGNLCKRKGVWDLVACAKNLPPQIRLILVGGEEDPGITEQLRRYVEREGLEQSVELVGPAVGQSKFRWLRKADIFVLPSYAEGVPISMLEALAAGLPAIVTPVGGIPSVLQDGEHALFVLPGDHSALTEAITKLAYDAAFRARIGASAQRHVLEHYGIEHTVQKYLKLYETLKPGLIKWKGQIAASDAGAKQ